MDDRKLEPEHAHYPLIFMTVLTQISLGGFAGLLLGDMLNFIGFNLIEPSLLMAIAVFLPSAIGLPLSALHLGRPFLALSAMKNWRNSWLSREAIALGIFTGGMGFVVFLYFAQVSQAWRLILQTGVLILGIGGIYAQSMIYRIPARPSWDRKLNTYKFFGTGYIGMLLLAFIALLEGVNIAPILSLALLYAGLQLYFVIENRRFFDTLGFTS
jgi:DMSO reductase anchor subunit